MNAVSDIAQQVDRAFWIIGGICMVLLVGITVTMIAFTVKFHRSRARTTKQFKVHYPLEITWSLLPTLLVIVMFFVGYQGFKMMRDVPPGAATINVIAQQWAWSFVYPDDGITSNRLFLPVGEPVKLNLTSLDVLHSFYLPAFRVKEDAVPGAGTFLWIQPNRTGRFHIFCAEFCGRDHARMYTDLVVVRPEEYRAWLDGKIADKNKPVILAEAKDPRSEEIRRRKGGEAFLTFCASCHGKDGRGGLVEGARNFTTLKGWKKSPKITDIFRTLVEGIPGTQMRSFKHLPAWDRFALSHHVRSFLKDAGVPEATSEEWEQLMKEYQLDKPSAPAKILSIEQAMRIVSEEAGHGGL